MVLINKAVSSYVLPQLFIFSFYFLDLTWRYFLYHCKWRVFDCLFKLSGARNCDSRLPLFLSLSCLRTQHFVSVTDFVTIPFEVFITNIDIRKCVVIKCAFRQSWSSHFFANSLFLKGKSWKLKRFSEWIFIQSICTTRSRTRRHVHTRNQTRKAWKLNTEPAALQASCHLIGRSEIQQETGASFKFQPIDKLTPPHETSCWDWSFGEVWCF